MSDYFQECAICGEEFPEGDLIDTENIIANGDCGLVCEDCIFIVRER